MTNQEINEAVGIKMGWKRLYIKDRPQFEVWENPDGKIIDGPLARIGHYFIPDYCTNIQATWEVIEHMCNIGKPPIIWFTDDAEACISFKYDEMVTDILSASIAICLAFLQLP